MELQSFYKDKTVAITGGNGYLGSTIISALKEMGAGVLCISRHNIPETDMQVKQLQADIKTKACWQEIVQSADIIFHLAGNTSIYAAAKDPVESLNSTVLPVTQLISVAKEIGRNVRVVFASTATVYGLADKHPVSEITTPPAPATLYDLHKLFAEEQLKFATSQRVVEGVALRLANVYGPGLNKSGSDDRGILNKVTRLALQGSDIQLYGDGNYLRDYVFIDDVVNAFLVAGMSENAPGHSLNVASGSGTTIAQAFNLVAEMAGTYTGKSVNIRKVPWPETADPVELRNFVADVGLFYRIAGWEPEISLQKGISLMIESFMRNS